MSADKTLAGHLMPISSRTPEGESNRCPVCDKDTHTDPATVPTRDAPCPHCGHLLWFGEPQDPQTISPSRSSSYDGLVISVGENKFGPIPEDLHCRLIAALDSLTSQGQLPPRGQVLSRVITAKGWPEVVRYLERLAHPEKRRSFSQRVGSVFQKRFQQVVAKLQA